VVGRSDTMPEDANERRTVVRVNPLHERVEAHRGESPEAVVPAARIGEPDLVLDEIPLPEPEVGGGRGQAHPFLALSQRLLDTLSLLAENGNQIERSGPQQEEMLERQRRVGRRLPGERSAPVEG